MTSIPKVTLVPSDWSAWIDRMPPGPASFHVTGSVKLSSDGYLAHLEPASPQGFNPEELILNLVLRAKPGISRNVVTVLDVRFDVSPVEINYTGVLIRPALGDSIHIVVQQVF